jgi:phage baseplate assembly protein gpV
MKIPKLLAVSLVVSSLAMTPVTVLAAQTVAIAEPSTLYEKDDKTISPRYTYVDFLDAGVYPSSSKVEYEMTLEGGDLRSFSGTVVLYKQLSSGTYQKIKSENLNIAAINGTVTHSGSASSQGSGKYRVTYSGTAYCGRGSEPVQITVENSY